MDWSIEIKKAENGYVAKWWEEMEDDDKWEEHTRIFEEIDSDELDAAKAMLIFVKEYFGIYGSKHDKRRLVVSIEEK